MAKPGDPATYDTLLKETAEEAKILVEALFQLLGLEVSPWPIKGRDTAIETLVETVPPLVQSIFTNLRYVFENGFQSQDDIHAGALFGMFNKYAPLILKAAGEPAIAALDFVKEPLMNMGNIAPGDQDKVASEIFGRAWTMGEMAHGLAILSGILPTGLGAAFSGFAAQVSLASGFREIAMAIHRSWYGIGIARPTAYEANAKFRSRYPGGDEGQALYARGLLAKSERDKLDAYDGLAPEFAAATQAGKYGGLQPRLLIRLMESGLFDASDFEDELTFRGMRPQSKARMKLAAPWLATQPYRTSLIAELRAAYRAGILSDEQLTDGVDDAQRNTDMKSLVLTTAKYAALVDETKALEAEYTALYLAGVMDEQDLVSHLQNIGLQPWAVHMIAGKAEAKANATLHRNTIKAAAALARATALEERKTAMKAFAAGALTSTALVASLVATGLTTTQAGWWVAFAELQKVGNQRWQFGLQLTPAQASILRAKVAALVTQREKMLINDQQLAQQLGTLGLDSTWVNAILAHAAAAAATAKAAELVPVQT